MRCHSVGCGTESQTLSATQSNMRSFAVDHQPTGRVGPNNAPTKLLLFRYQIPGCRVLTPNPRSRKSGCPSPLKSATPNSSQLKGRVGPDNAPTKTLLFMYQIPVWLVLKLKSTKSGCPSPLKSPTAITNQ